MRQEHCPAMTEKTVRKRPSPVSDERCDFGFAGRVRGWQHSRRSPGGGFTRQSVRYREPRLLAGRYLHASSYLTGLGVGIDKSAFVRLLIPISQLCGPSC